jgi:Fe-S-cluster containining protein
MELKLTPYDIVGIRSRLSISSSRFLDRYTHSRIDPESGFPLVILNQGKKGRCLFLRSYGCNIYPARPGACRSFPLSRGISLEHGESTYYLQELPAFCLGGEQDRVWTVEQWRKASDLEPFGRWNDFFVGVLRRVISEGKTRFTMEHLNRLADILYDFDSSVPTLSQDVGLKHPQSDEGMMSAIERLVEQFFEDN